jgi:hypothetical protein
MLSTYSLYFSVPFLFLILSASAFSRKQVTVKAVV